jgi:hypothetical protein
MGKVGSISVYEALRRLGLDVPIYHCHGMNRSFTDGEELPKGHPRWWKIQQYRLVRRLIEESPVAWNVVTMVRDPMARAISAFFQRIDDEIPGIRERFKENHYDMREIIDLFCQRLSRSGHPFEWFRMQMEPVFRIDVFASEFPKNRGYTIIEGQLARLLVLRLEDMGQCCRRAFRDFLGIRHLSLPKANVSENKWDGGLYKRFKLECEIPKQELDRMYESPLCRHFYSDIQIAGFRRKWERN